LDIWQTLPLKAGMNRHLSPQTLIAILSLVITVFVLIHKARADQGNMHHALDDLRSARASLNEAHGAKGGHRAGALNLVNRAIDEVKAGIASARKTNSVRAFPASFSQPQKTCLAVFRNSLPWL
jgi:hypothetical protein